MDDLLKELYVRYGNFLYTGKPIRSIQTALRIYKEGAKDIRELEEKIKKYEIKDFKQKMNGEYSELVEEMKFTQPCSFSMQMIYIWLVLDSMDEEFFNVINIEKLRLYQIVQSITFYLLFLQTDAFSDIRLSQNARKFIFGREDFYIGLTEAKKVCWSISEEDFYKFQNLFAFDINKNDVEELNEVQLFLEGESVFLLWINDFLEYILLDIEKKYLNWSKSEKYSNDKGFGFERMVYGFTSQFFENIKCNVFYHEKNKKSELDIIIEDGKYLIIVECKSGTIDLGNASSNKEIKIKVNNKLKKAYKTLDRIANYIDKNDIIEFVDKNNMILFKAQKKDYEIIYLHLSMYSMDSIASSIHILNDKYFVSTEIPKLTLSFEHFLAICIDCFEKKTSIGKYLVNRRDLLVKYPEMKFDNNELDLYYQLTNRSMLQDFIKDQLFDNFNNDIRFTSTFKDSQGKDTRPASTLLRQMENRLFSMIIDLGKRSFGLNKRYINYMNQYLRKEKNNY